MKKQLLAAAVSLAIATMTIKRAHTQDISFTYRMGAGFPGDVNRTHPFSAPPGLNDATTPARLYGDPVILDGTSHAYRGLVAGDGSATPIHIDGVAIRPYPTSTTTGGMNSPIGTGVPATNQPLDVLEDGYVIVKCNNFAANPPVKGGAVFVWCAVSSGNHVQGGFEAAASSTSTVPVTNAFWNGPTDGAGITELVVNRVGV